MPIAPGWAYQTDGAQLTGTTASGTGASLVVNRPNVVIDGDGLFLAVAHRSGAYCTPPAGWTLIEQGTTGAIWVELFWKRASGEPSTYTVTGLATAATASITAYTGMVPAGSPVESSSVRVVTTATDYRYTGLTTTSPHALVLTVLGVEAAYDPNWILRTKVDATASADSPPIDPAVSRLFSRTFVGTAAGGGVSHVLAEGSKPLPGPIGQGQARGLFGPIPANSVGICVALIPDTTTTTAGTRYYPTYTLPTVDLLGPLGGTWDATQEGPRGYDTSQSIWEASQQRAGGGDLTRRAATRNSPTGDYMSFRCCTPPLAAQTLGGTFDLCQFPYAIYVGLDAPTPTLRVRFHVVVYVTVGDSTAVRSVALDYVDTVDFLSGALEWRQLASPQALAAVSIHDGDRLMIELGARFIEATLPVPARPPVNWIEWGVVQGTCNSGSQLGAAGVAWPDAAAGVIGDKRTPWFAFSQTLIESVPAPSALPHVTCATATLVGSLPFAAVFDNRGSDVPQRAVWYRWTAPFTDRVIFHALGSTGGIDLHVYDHCGDDLLAGSGPDGVLSPDVVWIYNTQIATAVSHAVFDAQLGKTYYIRVRRRLDRLTAPASQGLVSVGFVRWYAPAPNDVILASQGFLARYTNSGQLVDLSGTADVYTGLAIDYTGRALIDNNTGLPHTGHRLLVASFASDNFIYVYDLARLNTGEDPVETIFDVLPDAAHHIASLAIDAAGRLWVGYFGDGFLRIANASTAFLDTIAANGSAPIALTDAAYGDSQPAAPFPAATVLTVPLEVGGTNYLDLTPDGTRLTYTSGGLYVPVGGTLIRTIEPTTGTVISTRTVAPGPGPNPGVKGLQPLADGTVLVCNGSAVYHLDATGTILQTFLPTPADQARSLVDVEVEEDGDHFWVLDEASATLFRFRRSTGAQVLSLYTRIGYGTALAFVIYRPNGVVPPTTSTLPTPCPAILDPLPVGGRVCPVTLTP